MTKRTKVSHISDSASGGKGESMATEIRTEAQRVAKNISDACVYADWFDLPAATLMVDEAITRECSRLASRVEELENLIAKRSGCSHCNDSGSGGIDK